MEDNPVGSYRSSFIIDETWDGRQVFLGFDGVASAFYVWINGEFVGYSQGNRTLAEFDITEYVQTGENKIAVEVYKYSDGSYLEDQDYWRLGGIYRDVYVWSTPKIHIRDFLISSALDDSFENGKFGVAGEVAVYDENLLRDITLSIELHDYEMDVSVNMRDASEYVFTAGAQAKANSNPLSLLTGPAAVAMKAKTEGNRFGITIRPASVSSELDETPRSFGLEQNYPNPFNPSTTISYTLETAGNVNISVYTLMGQKVATLVDEAKTAGTYSVRWNAAGAASGMYYYRLEAGGQSITRKMTLIK